MIGLDDYHILPHTNMPELPASGVIEIDNPVDALKLIYGTGKTIEPLDLLRDICVEAIQRCETLEELAEVRRLTLGKKGCMTVLCKAIGRSYGTDR